MIKKISLLLMISILFSMFSGCFDRREIDELAYVMAVGLDKGKTNALRMTLQIAIPSAATGGGKENGGGEGGSESSYEITVETPTIYSGINIANTFVSRQLNLSHTKALIFSEELAREGVKPYINAITRNREFRPDMNVLVSKTSAEKFIRNVKPRLEANTARYYELTLAGFNYTGFIANTDFHKFYRQSVAIDQQPVAILAAVSSYEGSEDIKLEDSTYKDKGRDLPFEGDFKAGKIPNSGGLKAEVMGLAVFRGDKMVGELDGEEAGMYLMATGEYNYSSMTFLDPVTKNNFIVLNVKQSRMPQQRIKMEGDNPHIYTKLILEADIMSIQSGINYEKPENLSKLEEAAENSIKEGMLRYLNRTARELNSDICGFGAHLKKNFLTWQDWVKFDWPGRYKDCKFDVEVDLKIRRPGLMVRTSPPNS
ncbi:MAG: Ger(x)C family spore germination protein [Clostridia bacterium]|nr:Ger(x)C family spore germination protein [Clostridia bacterium]